MEAEQKILKARVNLIFTQPFFATLAIRLTLKEDPNCETMWTDGKHMGYNPQFVEKLTLEELSGVICHEVMHNALQHHTRRQERNPFLWNIAGDFAINQILLDSGIILPKDRLYNPEFEKLSTEEIYTKLKEEMKKDLRQWLDKNKDKADPGGCGEVKDGEANSEKEWELAVAQAKAIAKQAGKLPGELDRIIDEILNPVLDWRIILNRFIQETAKNDYRMIPPNKRKLALDLYYPTMKSEEMDIVVAIDTSGSISDEDLNNFASEISAIAKTCNAKITVIYSDYSVRKVEEFTPQDEIKLNPKGGGGTSFIPPFKYLEENGITPTCLIYFTDLESDEFPEKPDFPVLWIVSGKLTPPWGEYYELRR